MAEVRNEVSRIHERYQVELRSGCVFGVDRKTRFIARLFQVFFPDYRLEIAQDWEDALQRVLEMQENDQTNNYTYGNKHRIPVDPLMVEKLATFIGSMSWQNQMDEIPSVASDHPLKEVYDAMILVKGDIEHLQDNQRHLTSELQQHQEKLQVAEAERQRLEQSLLVAKSESARMGMGTNHRLTAQGPRVRIACDEILAMAGLLRATDLTEEQNDYVRSVLEKSEDLRRYMDEILEYSLQPLD